MEKFHAGDTIRPVNVGVDIFGKEIDWRVCVGTLVEVWEENFMGRTVQFGAVRWLNDVGHYLNGKSATTMPLDRVELAERRVNGRAQ